MKIGDFVRVDWLDIVEVKECSMDRIPEPAHCVSFGTIVQLKPFLVIDRERVDFDCDRQSFPPGCIVKVTEMEAK